MSINQTIQDLHEMFPMTETRLPVLFVGHGSPMNAIENNAFSQTWEEIGKQLPNPRAILCVSAHWETLGTQVTGMEQPRTIHDFGGFPRQLYEMQYPAPGSPQLARLAQSTTQKTLVKLDSNWGLDHGTWSVLARMFPAADIPVVQLSLDHTQRPEYHYALARELMSFRQRGVLVVGSGNIVHNLGLIAYENKGFDWAIEFDETIKQLILKGDDDSIIHYEKLGKAAALAIPTNEHYLPLLYILALREANEAVKFFADQLTFGSLSMRSLWVG